MKGLWLEKATPRGQENHVPSGLCHLVFYVLLRLGRGHQRSGYWELHRISQYPRAFPDIVGGSSYQEMPSKTNTVFTEIVEEKAILGWTLLGATDMTDGLETKSSLLSLISCKIYQRSGSNHG